MDESWRMRMGMPTSPPPPPSTTTLHIPKYPPRRSTEDTTSHRRGNPISDGPLNLEDFSDVFGGPPRTILSRQFPTGSQTSPSSSTSFFYPETFQPTDKSPSPVGRSGRSLPGFRIPGQQNNDFYSDIFGWDDHDRMVRSRSRSKGSSSSVLSSEELSPLRPTVPVDGNNDVPYFGSKLRPINVSSRWMSRSMTHEEDYQRQKNVMPPYAFTQTLHNAEKICPDNLKSYSFGLSRRNTSPKTISLEPMSNRSFRISADDLEINSSSLSSSSSSVSSTCDSYNQELKIEDEILRQDAMDDEDENEAMSSYVIEINSGNRDGICESNGVDEAIAWAKEKFQTQCAESKQEYGTKKPAEETLHGHQVSEQWHTVTFGSSDEQHDKWGAVVATEEWFEYTVQTETQNLDEKLRLWSAGKEADMRLLLSCLHQILWTNSGWSAMPPTNLTEISQVRKAYQKAQLCLHPDKLQQRGATIQQKYIAKKVFSLLQMLGQHLWLKGSSDDEKPRDYEFTA
ncbi:hypothetical protein OROGR_002951 [Orobanche gracilis]